MIPIAKEFKMDQSNSDLSITSTTKKRELVSFLTGKPLTIPENDLVSYWFTVWENFIISYLILFPLQYGKCRFVGEFEKINRVGEGTYGVVCKWSLNNIWFQC